MVFSLVKNVKHDGKLHDSIVLPSTSDWSIHEKLIRVPYCIGRARGCEEKWRVFVVYREKRGRAFLRKVGREGTDHAHGCVLRCARAQDSQERYRILFVPVANARAIHSVSSRRRDRGKWKEEFFCIESSIETCYVLAMLFLFPYVL